MTAAASDSWAAVAPCGPRRKPPSSWPTSTPAPLRAPCRCRAHGMDVCRRPGSNGRPAGAAAPWRFIVSTAAVIRSPATANSCRCSWAAAPERCTLRMKPSPFSGAEHQCPGRLTPRRTGGKNGSAHMQDAAHRAVDPMTLEVIRHGLVSITNQIDANIKRTAFSPYIYEYNDFAVGLTDADGQLIAQCTGGMPPFVADSVGMAVRDGLAIYGRDRLHPGDVVLCNHAAVQGQHLNNTVMYTPIHAEATLIGFFAINVHWIDIAGAVPHSPDIFGEGLQLRSIKLWKKGEPVEEVYRIIESNTRQPTELLGDIAAQLAGCLYGRDLVAELVGKYGIATFERAVEIILDQSEAAARALIRSMPDGVYTHETFLDNDRNGDAPLPIRVKVIVTGDEMTVDYSGIADQVKGPINSGWFGGGQTTARVAFKYLLGATEMANEGTFRPLKLVLPPGKILSADPTAPMGNYSTPFPTVIDAVIKALEKALPERVPGGHFGTHSGIRFSGRRPDGSYFATHDSGHGGWGACATHDGAGPFRTMAHGDTRIIPLELQESY